MKLARMPTAAVLGVLSGALSYLSVLHYPKILTLQGLIGKGEDGVSLLPGLVFGVAVALSVALHDRAQPAKLAVAVALVFLGWAAAYHAALFAFAPLDAILPGGMARGDRQTLAMAVAMNVGSLVGGAATVLAVMAASGRRIPGSGWAVTLLTGALVVVFDVYGVGAGREDQLMLILFVLWQSGMLVTLHATLARLDEEEKALAGRPGARA